MNAGEMTYGAIADRAADQYGVPRAALRAIISQESGWDTTSFLAEQGGDGSVGLCQVLFSTAQGMGFTGTIAQLQDPATNCSYGAQVFASALQNAQAVAPNADPLTWLQMAASAYNGGYRPSLGFGAPAAVTVTVCLRHDPNTGACLEQFTAQPGQYGNQAYVDAFTSYFNAEGGDTTPLSGTSASGGGGASTPVDENGATASPPSSSYLALDAVVGIGLAALVGVVLLLTLNRRSPAL